MKILTTEIIFFLQHFLWPRFDAVLHIASSFFGVKNHFGTGFGRWDGMGIGKIGLGLGIQGSFVYDQYSFIAARTQQEQYGKLLFQPRCELEYGFAR